MKSAGEYAASLLIRRRYTEKELLLKMKQKQYDSEETEEIVAYLKENGSLDDADYAKRYVHDALHLKKQGRIRIRRELLQKGINEDVIENAFQSIIFDEKESIEAFLLKIKTPEQESAIRRLAYRGFSYEDIQEVWAKIYG